MFIFMFQLSFPFGFGYIIIIQWECWYQWHSIKYNVTNNNNTGRANAETVWLVCWRKWKNFLNRKKFSALSESHILGGFFYGCFIEGIEWQSTTANTPKLILEMKRFEWQHTATITAQKWFFNVDFIVDFRCIL